jgi:hypothetical protein
MKRLAALAFHLLHVFVSLRDQRDVQRNRENENEKRGIPSHASQQSYGVALDTPDL